MSARSSKIKALAKQAFFTGVKCPACGVKLKPVFNGKRPTVPDAVSIVDNGKCLSCVDADREEESGDEA